MQPSIPEITPELLAYLKSLYKDSSPSPGTPIDQIFFRSGQVDVVRHLEHIHEQQQENILQGG